MIQSKRIALGLAAMLQIGAGAAHAKEAQTAQSAKTPTQVQQGIGSGDIIITARRRSEALSQVPVVATVLSGAALEKQGVSNLQQLGNLTPGLNITSTIYIDSIFLRGVGSSPNDPGFEQQTGLFIDGIYYGNGRWVSSASFDSSSVEVLSGPQGVYFGKNTIAGAVNIATNNPGDTFEGYLKAGYEFNAEEKYVEGVVSGPLSDTFGARLSLRASDQDGWATNANNGKGEPGGKDYVGRLTLAWTPSDAFDANFKAQIQNYEDNGPTARTILLNCQGPGNTPAPLSLQGFPIWGPTSGTAPCTKNFKVPNPTTLREGDPFSKVPAYTTALTMHWRNNLGELTSTTGFNHYKFTTYEGLNTSSLDLLESRNGAENDAFSTELRYRTTLDGPLNFMVGAYYQSTDFKNFSAPSILPAAFQGAATTFDQRSSTKGTTQSYSAEALYDITKTLELDVGVRYTDEEKKSRFDTRSVAPNVVAFFPPLHFGAAQEFSNTSPQATLTWRPNSDFMLYAAYKTGFLSGGFAHAQLTSPFSQTSDFLFGPEKVKGGEIGTKFFLADRRVQINAVAYAYDYDGLQLSTFQPASFTFAVQNAGKSEARGAELSGRWKVDDHFTLNGSLNYGTSEYTQFIGACLPTATFATGCNVALPGGAFAQDFKGFSTSFAPEWAGRLALDYNTTLANGILLNAGIGVNYSDDYIVGDVLNQPSKTKYDGRVSLDFGRWSTALIGNNLSNEAICNQASSRALGGVGETNCWLDRGREVRLEATVKF